VLPVHNEERHLPVALRSLDRAMRHVADDRVECRLAVVLDDCSDGSAEIVERWLDATRRASVDVVPIRSQNVGLARRTGCAVLLERWATAPVERIWLATTDADSEVPDKWLTAQLQARAEGAHIWVGRVRVRSWGDRIEGSADEWHRQYAREQLPVHGANLGVDAATYLGVGGFDGLATGEDRDLLDRILVHGAVAHSDETVRVTTSSRRHARAPRGFAHALSGIEDSLSVAAAAS
jgi:glycosyltransferase involved in cell wall biosynthesis